MPVMFIIFGRLVNNFADYFVPDTTTTQAEFQRAVDHNSLYLVYIFIGKWVLGYISLLCIRISGMRISSALRLAYIRALFAQPISMVDNVSPGKVSSRITTSANTIQLGISQQFSLFIQAVTFTIGAYVVAFIKSALLTLVASACIPFILISLGTTLPFFIRIHKKTVDLLEEGSSLSFEIFSSIRIVVAFGAEEQVHARYASTIDRAAQNERKCGPIMGMMMSPMFFSSYATMALAFWFGIRQYIHHHLSSVGSIAV
jgi:ABC-type bacteriocin/lantibiotic exporter with double-glycine peptidase domain